MLKADYGKLKYVITSLDEGLVLKEETMDLNKKSLSRITGPFFNNETINLLKKHKRAEYLSTVNNYRIVYTLE